MMASIRKRIWRVSGKRRVAWLVDYRDGLNRRKVKQFSSEAEARAWLETTDLRSVSTTTNGKSVADAAQAWIDRAEADELERSTIADYRWAQRYIAAYIGSISLAELTRDQVITFKKELAHAKSKATAQRTIHTLKMMLNQAVDDGWVGRNVARRLRSAKSARHRKALKKKITVPIRADLKAMVAFLEKRVKMVRVKRAKAAREEDPKKAKKLRDERNMAERSRPLFEFVFASGARPSEVRGLAWTQVHFDRGVIEITQRVDRWNEMGDCKTEASFRDIPVSKHLLDVLREWKELCPPSKDDLVFPTAGGSPLSSRNLHREFAQLQLAAGVTKVAVGADGNQRLVKKYTLKDCRHGAASWWIHNRLNLKDLTSRLGHSSIQVTFDVYGHLIKEVEESGPMQSDMDDDLYS